MTKLDCLTDQFLPTVDAARLKDVPFSDFNRALAEATLMPMFDGDGQVKSVLIVDSESSGIWYIKALSRLKRRPWSRELRFAGEIDEVNAESIGFLHRLWHYDPWWLLKQGRYDANEFVPALKSTNCVNEFVDEIKKVYFCGKLNRIRWLLKVTRHGESLDKFRSKDLPIRLAKNVVSYSPPVGEIGHSQHVGWKLAPFWQQ